MCKGILGQKLGMTGVFLPDGRYVPVTMVKAGPCVVTQIKTKAVDGYDALQIGFGEKKPSRTTRPLKGHFAKSGGAFYAHLREVGVDDPSAYEVGQEIPVDLFAIGERVNVTGRSKGRGFSGVIKRHGFHGGKKTHGSKSHRIPGSIGCSAWPSKVVKGKKLPGQYGNERKTIRNLEIVDIRPEDHLLMIRGAVPGAASGLLVLNKTSAGASKSE
jgi:large subunit ribosomal protein L3